MKLFTRLLLLIPLIAVGGLFVLPGPDGRRLLTLDDLRLPDLKLPDLPDVAVPGLAPDSGTTTFYKWQDEAGRWHYGASPPPDRPAVAVTVDPNANVLDAPARPAAAPAEDPATPAGGLSGTLQQLEELRKPRSNLPD